MRLLTRLTNTIISHFLPSLVSGGQYLARRVTKANHGIWTLSSLPARASKCRIFVFIIIFFFFFTLAWTSGTPTTHRQLFSERSTHVINFLHAHSKSFNDRGDGDKRFNFSHCVNDGLNEVRAVHWMTDLYVRLNCEQLRGTK